MRRYSAVIGINVLAVVLAAIDLSSGGSLWLFFLILASAMLLTIGLIDVNVVSCESNPIINLS